MKTPRRLLISRTDKLGDVLLSLPALALIRREFPEAEIDFLVNPQLLSAIRPFLETQRIRPVKKGSSLKGYDGALLLSEERATAWRALTSRIPVRVGVGSKWWSFLFLSVAERQSRSQAQMTEAEYNVQLAHTLAMEFGTTDRVRLEPVAIPVCVEDRQVAETLVHQWGLSEREYLVVHPGNGGSSLNLSEASYLKLVNRLGTEFPGKVLLSCGPSPTDKRLVEYLRRHLPDIPVLRDVTLGVLREVFRLSLAVIGPATGPIHLAHFAGTKTIGFYPPVQSMRRERWISQGGTGSAIGLVPGVDCPGKRACLGKSCPFYFCMDEVDWGDLTSKALKTLGSGAYEF